MRQIINIGSETTSISIFNKGIIIKDDIINLGSKNIDKDISYIYGVDIETGKGKENKDFAVENEILKTVKPSQVSADGSKITINGQAFTVSGSVTYYDANGDTTGKETAVYATAKITVSGQKIVISSDKFPETYYVTGDTYARSEATGKDEFFQFIIPKAKMQSEVTLTMEAEGDPSTFNMNLKVLRPANGEMMKLVKYSLPE